MKKFFSHTIILRMAMAFSAVAILTGCSPTEEEEQLDNAPLLLSSYSPETRAASALGEYTDFGVWAWKVNADASESLVLGRKPSAEAGSEYYTRIVGDDWSYEYSDGTITQYIRYWDRAATNYYFSAYSPYTIGSEAVNKTHNITATKDGVNISAVAGNTPVGTGIDWLEASWRRQISPTLTDIDLITNKNYTTANLTDIVPLAFHHILATTEFRIYSGTGAPVTVTSLSITLDTGDAIYTQANYSAGEWNDKSNTATTLYQSDSDLNITGTDKEHSTTLTSLLQIPQDITTRTIQVSITTSEGTRSGSFVLTEGWASEKKYIYYLCIKGSSSAIDEIILMDFEVEDWGAGGDIIVSDPIVNW